jgi:hypothetical protein
VLGLPIAREADFRPDARWIELSIPGTKTNIALVTWFESMPPGCMRGIVLLTGDIERAFRTLQTRGLETSAVQAAPWGKYLTFSDPDGNGWVMNEGTLAASWGGAPVHRPAVHADHYGRMAKEEEAAGFGDIKSASLRPRLTKPVPVPRSDGASEPR